MKTQSDGGEIATDGDFAVIRAIETSARCEDGLRLRQRLNKLLWMRLDAEADQFAAEIGKLDCELPRWPPLRPWGCGLRRQRGVACCSYDIPSMRGRAAAPQHHDFAQGGKSDLVGGACLKIQTGGSVDICQSVVPEALAT